MGNAPPAGVEWPWLRGFGPRILAVGVVLVAGLAVGSALHVTPVSALTACDASASSVLVQYQLAPPSSGTPPSISRVTMSGFPGGCNGDAVKFEMRGNSAGDPSLPASADTLLSTADSTRDPCSQAVLASPREVAAGTIDLPLCATGGAAAYVPVRTVTLISLFVNGAPARVGGVAGISTGVPAAGLADQVFNGLFGLGLGLLIVGIFSVIASARSRRRPAR